MEYVDGYRTRKEVTTAEWVRLNLWANVGAATEPEEVIFEAFGRLLEQLEQAGTLSAEQIQLIVPPKY